MCFLDGNTCNAMGVKFAVIYKHIPLPLFRYQFAENRKAI